jgi:predicted DNA-binding transcriptional regulator AlpA
MEAKITFEGLPMAISSLAEEVKQIKALILETSTKDGADSILTIEETSEFLHVQKQTLYSYVSKGLIPNHKRAGRVYFLKGELIDCIKSGNKRPFDVEAEAKKIISKKKGGRNE